jgi:anaerobic ribonucleoside-triphosphate reductase
MEEIKTEQKIAKITEIGANLDTTQEDSIAGDNVPRCPYFGSTNVYGISRVVGYFSIIDNWNKSKKAELKRRQEGNYWSDQ